MILLRSRSLVFFKPKRVASTSVEIALSTYAEAGDIATPISMQAEFQRRDAGGFGPTGWSRWKPAEHLYRYLIDWGYQLRQDSSPNPGRSIYRRTHKSLSAGLSKTRRYFNHIAPATAMPLLESQELERPLVVTVCRHPYDQLVSQAHLIARRMPGQSVEDCIDSLLARPAPNTHYYLDGERLLYDRLLRFENLQRDLAALGDELGMPELTSRLPFTHRTVYRDNRGADFLSESQRWRCRERNAAEFELFGYPP